MRILLRISLLSIAAVALTGCATGKSIRDMTPQEIVQNAKDTIAAVKDGAALACSFVPDDMVVSQILQALDVPIVGSVAAGIDVICGAVQRRSGAGPIVANVKGRKIPITGKFTRKR